MPPERDEHAGGETAERDHEDLGERLGALESAIDDLKRRQVVAELRADPGRLLAGVGDVRRLARQDLDDLAEVLARWDVPLSPDEELQLQQVALVAQGVSGPRRSTVHLVVGVASRACTADLETVARAARVLTDHGRRAIPVLVALTPLGHDPTEAALALGVEIVVDA
ncbi:MAG: hypothetical protein WAL04_12180 [Acidimicrobiales bacterium]